ncbi:hypothetical protein VZT92_026471 [Zoarces viviparus]|uniref:Uncharacterized protein n=1 Tax=Zoarces viviparus TaxID=48416 RepID=A0AAW1DZQ6_ZOAVI
MSPGWLSGFFPPAADFQGRVVHVYRRLFPCSHGASPQAVSTFRLLKAATFQSKVLPFGLSHLPMGVHKVCYCCPFPLQSQGVNILPYLGDRLTWAPSRLQALQDTARLLSRGLVGLKVNMERSYLSPSQSMTFICVAL